MHDVTFYERLSEIIFISSRIDEIDRDKSKVAARLSEAEETISQLHEKIAALEKAPKNVALTLFTDSQYVKKGVSDWSHKWKANGWKTASGGVVKNQDLWKKLTNLCESHPGSVQWEWVKGHSGDVGNTRADELAVKAMNAM